MRDLSIVLGLALAAVGVGVFVFFSGRAQLPPRVERAQIGTPVPVTALAAGTRSSVALPANYLITSDPELRELWAMTDAEGSAPAVDFSKDSVIAVFAGAEPSAGYAVAVSGVADTPSARTVRISFTKPGGSCVLAQVATAPYEIVELPRTALPLVHEAVVQTTSCLQ